MKHLIPILFFLIPLPHIGYSLHKAEAGYQDAFLHQIMKTTVSSMQEPAIVDVITDGDSDEFFSYGQAGEIQNSPGSDFMGTDDFGYTDYTGHSGMFADSDVADNPTDIPPRTETIRLEEASPNPARGHTWISYYLPTGTNNARLVIRNLLGTVVKNENIDVNADGVRLSTGDLNNGIYIYSLMINNQAVKSKRLVVAN
jgi:hypothetical protein